MKKITKSIQLLLGVFLFCVHTTSVAQTLLKPELDFGDSACDPINGTPGDFNFSIEFSGALFGVNNEFTIQLSNPNGVFEDANGDYIGTDVKKVSDPRNTIPVPASFQLPDDTFGTGYRLRVVSSNPVMTSPPSDAFEAYKVITQGDLILNEFEHVTVCGNSGSSEITLNTSIVGNYLWFRDEVLIGTTTEPSFNVTQTGTYQAKIQYGLCGEITSTLINAFVLTDADAQITGNSTVQICSDASHTFTAASNNDNYTYTWFKDNTQVKSSNENFYTTPNAGQFGEYRLEVTSNDCTVNSQTVTLEQQTEPDFTVTNESVLESILLPCEVRELVISHDADNARVEWYINDVLQPGSTGLSIVALQPGKYVARVIKTTTGSCDVSVDSEPYLLWAPEKFVDFTIRTNDNEYQDCTSSNEKLVIVGVKVENEEGTVFDLTDEQLNPVAPKPTLLNLQWYKDGEEVGVPDEKEHIIDSYLDNGVYDLEIRTCNNSKTGRSNELSIKLIAIPEVTSSSPSNALCAGSTIDFTIDELLTGYTYEWFKDDDVTPIAVNEQIVTVDEIGTYVLKITGFGCTAVEVEEITVVPFDDSVVQIEPSEKVVLNPGETVTVNATGADSYVWHLGEDDTGVVLFTNGTLTVDALGFYTVVATVGTCTVTKTIEVVEQDDQVIVPNVVTPNGDGKNDTWKISNRYAFQPSVTIVIYNANGKELINLTDYKNDWPLEDLKNQRTFYYKIIRDEEVVKAGTISVLH